MTDKERLRTLAVIKKLPCRYGRKRAKNLPPEIIGATIINIGMAGDGQSVEGGGLVIDYRSTDSASIRRVVLAFNELGMWPVLKSMR